MSHSMVIVLVEPSGADVENEVTRLMVPFDETLDMPEHEVVCWCVGREAKDEADKALDEKMGTWDDARKAHHENEEKLGVTEKRKALFDEMEKVKDDKEKQKPIHEQIDALESEAQKRWLAKFYEPRQKFWHSVFDVSPKKDSPKSDCDECKGTGKHMSTSNEKARFDWYRIGGRWDGVMCALPEIDDREGGFNFGDGYETLERNSCLASEIKMKNTAFAVLTPDGEWHERGDMGWWGMVNGEKDKDVWEKEFRALLKKWKNCTAVSVDVHI